MDAVQIPDTIAQIERWISLRERMHYVAVTGMHGVTEAQGDPAFRKILNSADLVVPDGMPLVWLGRRAGQRLPRRVYGPELMESFFRSTGTVYRHFLYGGAEGVAERLAKTIAARFGVEMVGTYSPPFRPLSAEESDDIIARINRTRPDVVWVGLSTPKQERWMHDHSDRLDAPVAIGVGAAFDMLAGLKKMAPPWMQEHGFEWLYRLGQEPRRLWRRYLVGGAKFGSYLALERAGLRRLPPT
ncbi:MAG: WecB/TagA/CpsF family glycosyltransferase [Actinomycetota bacterium]